jgi:hypothetical protein
MPVEKAAANVLYLEAALEQNRAVVREWVKAVGAVKVGKVVFDYWPTARWEIEVKGVVEACRRHGVPLESVLRVDKKQLDRVAKVAREFGATVAPLVRDVGSTKFDWKKEGADDNA